MTGYAVLFLMNGCNLTINGGIDLNSGQLIITCQEGNTGKLTVIGSDYNAGIGGNKVDIGHDNGGFPGTLMIMGGNIKATGGTDAAGIGSGWYDINHSSSGGSDGTLYIGGTAKVEAIGIHSPGIGCGVGPTIPHAFNSIYIGTMGNPEVRSTTKGADSEAIFCAGFGGRDIDEGSSSNIEIRTLEIAGGTVEIDAGGSKGNGSGIGGNFGEILLTGGDITITGGDCTALQTPYHAMNDKIVSKVTIGGSFKTTVNNEDVYWNRDILKQRKEVHVGYYDVTFDSQGGSNVASKTVKIGNTVAKPSNPTRSGSRFKSWQLEGEDYNFSSKVINDITLLATWDTGSGSGSAGGSSTLPNTDSSDPRALLVFVFALSVIGAGLSIWTKKI